MTFRCCVPRRSIASSVAFLALGLATAATAANPPEPTAIAPNAASPGAAVVISGNDLGGPADSLLVWVRTSAAGFLFDDVAPSGSDLSATVGPVGSAATGLVQAWSGRRIALAPTTTRIDDHLLSALEAHVFIAHRASSGGPLFSALASSPQTVASSLLDNRLVIDVGPLFPMAPGDAGSIRVDAVIETGGSKKGTGTSGGSGSTNGDPIVMPADSRHKSGTADAGPALAFHVIVATDSPFEESAEASAAERLAAALAVVLGESFGSLGLVVSADGSQLVIDSVGGVLGGFATISADS